MRYYDLKILDPTSGDVWKPDARGNFIKSPGGSTFTSHPQGLAGPVNPGALNIEFDVPVYPFNTPQGGARICVWGVGLGMIGQAAALGGNGTDTQPAQNIKLSAGMGRGLPLANPAQAGLIMQGTIFQAFGNWQGVNQTLELIVNPPAAAQNEQDIMFNWPAGTSLASALTSTFQQAFSKYKMTSKVNVANLVQAHDEPAHYPSLSAFASFITQRTKELGSQIYGNNYSGVQITITGNTIYAYDNMTPKPAIQLAFTDLIGQPTWIDAAVVNFKTVLRSDIAVGDRVKFPEQGMIAPYVLTTPSGAFPGAPSRVKSIFQGTFTVREVHHFANFRQPDADSWVTTFDAVAGLPATPNLLTATLGL